MEEALKLERLATEAAEAKVKAEQAAAIRSLKTNLTMIFVFILPPILFYIFKSKIDFMFCLIILLSVQKGVAKVLTTIANFGNIRDVLRTYFHSPKK